MTAADGSIWVAGTSLARIDERTGRVLAAIPLIAASPADMSYDLTSGFGSIWIRTEHLDGRAPHDQLIRVDPKINAVVWTMPLQASGNVYIGSDSVWIADTGRVLRLDPSNGDIVGTIEIANPGAMAEIDGHLWVGDVYAGTISRIDTNRVDLQATLPGPVVQLATNSATLWGIDDTNSAVYVLNPQTGAVEHSVRLPRRSRSSFADPGQLWVGMSPTIAAPPTPNSATVALGYLVAISSTGKIAVPQIPNSVGIPTGMSEDKGILWVLDGLEGPRASNVWIRGFAS